MGARKRNGSLNKTLNETAAGDDLDMVAWMDAMDSKRRSRQNEMARAQPAPVSL